MAAQDPFINSQGGLQSPVRSSFAITPSDTTELPFVTRAVYVGSAGNLTARLADDTASATFNGLPPGTVLPLRVRQIFATGNHGGDGARRVLLSSHAKPSVSISRDRGTAGDAVSCSIYYT
jgi:hypothetical protein